jgi:hypothetical protein
VQSTIPSEINYLVGAFFGWKIACDTLERSHLEGTPSQPNKITGSRHGGHQ